jgi:hypothetical protein
LQDLFAKFFIVADVCRKKEFEDKLNVSMFSPLQKRVEFLEYGKVTMRYEGLTKVHSAMW